MPVRSSRRVQASSKHSLTPGDIALRLLYVGVLASWIFVAGSLLGFDKADPPTPHITPVNDPVHNWCGMFGARIAYASIELMGIGAYVLIALTGIGLFSLGLSRSEEPLISRLLNNGVRFIGLLLFSASLAGMQNLIFPSSGPFPGLAGGTFGMESCKALTLRFGGLGTALILLFAMAIGAVVAMDQWVIALCSWTWNWTRERAMPAAVAVGTSAGAMALNAGSMAGKAAVGKAKEKTGGFWASFVGSLTRKPVQVREHDLDDADEVDEIEEAPTRRGRGSKAKAEIETLTEEEEAALEESSMVIDEDEDDELGEELEQDAIKQAKREAREAAKAKKIADAEAAKAAKLAKANQIPLTISKPAAGTTSDAQDEATDDEDDALPGAPQVFSEAALRAKVEKLPIFFGANEKQTATDADLKGMQSAEGIEGVDGDAAKPYRFPGLDLLENPEENFNSKLEEYVREQAAALVAALEQFRIAGEVDSIESGPVITLFHVRLSPGTKVAVLEAVSKDIARVLKAQNIRIVPNMVGRDTVGIEVPNAHKERVRLKELMGKVENFEGMKLPLFLGKDASGEPLIEDLAKMPHMLIAGTTGSGKSVCMNTIIMGFLYTKKPSELKMVLVDPKMVEMSQFKDIPHLMCPVVTEMAKAAAILEWACRKMDERYELLAEAGCRDIAGYNELTWEELKERFNPGSPEEEARIPRRLPYMVFIIDELADLMMTNKEVEGFIIRIAQKARAVGMHMILATQRPQANVVTGLIKSNMPCRVAFKVASGMDSRIVLDQKGGELLLGHGDMLVLSPRSSKLTRAQGTLVDDKEIRNVVRFMRDVAGPSFERQLLQIRAEGSDEARVQDSKNNSSASLAAAQEDPMFSRAVEIVLETRRGSVSLLQRRLAIGYTRASRLIDLMGIAGIISDHKGSVARDVLITPAEWDAMKKMAAEQGVVLGDRQGELFEAPASNAAVADDVGAETQTDAEIEAGTDDAEEDESDDESDSDDEAEVSSVRVVPADGPGTERYVEEAPFADEADKDDDWNEDGGRQKRRQKPQVVDEDDNL